MATKLGRIASLGRTGKAFVEVYLDSGQKVELPHHLMNSLAAQYAPTDVLVFVERRGRLFKFVQWVGTPMEALDALRSGVLTRSEVPVEVELAATSEVQPLLSETRAHPTAASQGRRAHGHEYLPVTVLGHCGAMLDDGSECAIPEDLHPGTRGYREEAAARRKIDRALRDAKSLEAVRAALEKLIEAGPILVQEAAKDRLAVLVGGEARAARVAELLAQARTFQAARHRAEPSLLAPAAEGFLAVLPPYLGMGVREPFPTVDVNGRFVMRYVWDAATVARVSSDNALEAWQIEDLRPSGDRASMSSGRSFSDAARLYASSSLGDGGRGPTGEWLLERTRLRASRFVLVPPPPGVSMSYVPAVALVHLLAAMSPDSAPPVLATGRFSGIQPEPMPFGVRAKPTIVTKTVDGLIRTQVAIGLAEYVTPAIDAVQHIVQLCGEPAVVSDRIPVVGVIFSGALEFGAKFADGQHGERWVLDTGPVDRAFVMAAAAAE